MLSLGLCERRMQKPIFAGCSAAEPIGVLDLKYGSLVDSIDPPPTPPSGHPGLKSVRAKACHGALGRPFFDHFFESILKSILDSFWVRFGLVLGSFCPLLGAQIGSSWAQNVS